jgi:hypothetical protein
VGLLFSFVDSSFKLFGQDGPYAINLIRSPFFSNDEWRFVCLKIQVGKKTYINHNSVPGKLLRIGHGTGGSRKEKQKTVGSALFFVFSGEQLFLFSVIRSNQNCI